MRSLFNLILLSCFFLFPISAAQACDLSCFRLDSVIQVGSEYEIYATLCIGAGVSGPVPGGDAGTRDMAIGFYSPGGAAMNLNAFSPTQIVGQFTGAVLAAVNFGPTGPPFNAQATMGYLDPFYPPDPDGYSQRLYL